MQERCNGAVVSIRPSLRRIKLWVSDPFHTRGLKRCRGRGNWPKRPYLSTFVLLFSMGDLVVYRRTLNRGLAPLLHASFRPRLATTPLCFGITSPPSECEEDFHRQAVEHCSAHIRTAGHPRPAAYEHPQCLGPTYFPPSTASGNNLRTSVERRRDCG